MLNLRVSDLVEATNTILLQALRDVGKIIGDVTFVKGISDVLHLLGQCMPVFTLALPVATLVVDFFLLAPCFELGLIFGC